MLTLNQTLTPIGYRVEWAKKHLGELERKIEEFIAAEPYKVEKKPDPNTLVYCVTALPGNQPLEYL